MKPTLISICAFILVSLNSCSQDFIQLKESKIDTKKVESAEKFAKTFFTQLRNGNTYEFHDEAIDIIKNQLNKENQLELYKQIKGTVGDFRELEFADVWIQVINPDQQIIRFKAFFEKNEDPLCIQVIMDNSNKISGFWLRPWTSEYVI